MKSFPTTINTILHRSPFNAAKLCDEAGLSEGNFSRVRSGTKEITQDLLSRLLACDIIPVPDRNLLLLSYLRDKVPQGFQNSVSITLQENGMTVGELLIDPLREAVEYLYQRALTDPDMHNHITGLHRLLKPVTPK